MNPVCNTCQEKPEGCWRSEPCNIKRASARTRQDFCPIGKWDYRHYFDRVVVISLARRADRLKQFYDGLPKDFPYKRPELFVAIDGRTDPGYPPSWGGGGSWGCRESHMRVLQAAMDDRIRRLLVFEDDCIFCDDFSTYADTFLKNVPADWDCLMFGGQHRNGPREKVAPGVVKCFNTQRTHAYAVQGQFMVDLHRRWGEMTSGHIDHVMGPFARDYRTYAASPFVCGQREGQSNISGRMQVEHFWGSVTKTRRITLSDHRKRRQEIINNARCPSKSPNPKLAARAAAYAKSIAR